MKAALFAFRPYEGEGPYSRGTCDILFDSPRNRGEVKSPAATGGRRSATTNLSFLGYSTSAAVFPPPSLRKSEGTEAGVRGRVDHPRESVTSLTKRAELGRGRVTLFGRSWEVPQPTASAPHVGALQRKSTSSSSLQPTQYLHHSKHVERAFGYRKRASTDSFGLSINRSRTDMSEIGSKNRAPRRQMLCLSGRVGLPICRPTSRRFIASPPLRLLLIGSSCLLPARRPKSRRRQGAACTGEGMSKLALAGKTSDTTCHAI